MNKRTRSESIFLKYCEQHGLVAEPIDCRIGRGKSPDFFVKTTHGDVIVEVKELNANSEDKRYGKESVSSGSECVGRRPRNMILHAIDQLEAHADNNLPCVIVLYDNIVVNGERPHPPNSFLSPEHIDVAMYSWIWMIHECNDGNWELKDEKVNHNLNDRFGVGVSAVSVLSDHAPLLGPRMVTYHNYFTRLPLSIRVFAGPLDVNLVKPDHPERYPDVWKDAASYAGTLTRNH